MSESKLRLCLVLHNHQPIGNFEDVIEAAYRDSYLPFLETLERRESLPISLHISGPLAEWLVEHRPDYVHRVRRLVDAGRVEIVGGAFYEPILTMIPSHDRLGQIERYRSWLSDQFGTPVRGMWIPERVWEASLTRDLVDAGVEYTVLDDFHFRSAGLEEHQLTGDFVVEDEGRLLRVFPGSEKLRYLIPFQEPEQTIAWLRAVADRSPGATVVFADDGEKFGTWPDTHRHVYEDGWLDRFLDALEANREWLSCGRLSDAVDQSPPVGNIWLPNSSYREMTEWSLPSQRLVQYEDLTHAFEGHERWSEMREFIRGGFWRNFRQKYPEIREMYGRMMDVSQRIESLTASADHDPRLDEARDLLYRGQCNCAWWHGAFGGVYLPHLRNAVYQNLIAAENVLDKIDPPATAVHSRVGDFDFDLANEVRIANPELVAWFAPGRGGHLYELDVRAIRHNLLATLHRQPEAYHEKVRRGNSAGTDEAASIHDRVVFKQEGLQDRLQYDAYPRKSLVDHFWSADVRAEDVRSGRVDDIGDFATGRYESTLRTSADRHQIKMTRLGNVAGNEIRLTKAITLDDRRATLEMVWLLEGLTEDSDFLFGPEFNFAGMPAGQDDRFFSDPGGKQLGHLGEQLELSRSGGLCLTDQWLGLQVRLQWDQPGNTWTWPIETVSQSEAGFELIHQSVVVQPVWQVSADVNGRWAVRVTMELTDLKRNAESSPVSQTTPADMPALAKS